MGPSWAPAMLSGLAMILGSVDLKGELRETDRRLDGIDHRNAEAMLERLAMAGHAGAAQHQHIGPVFRLQLLADLAHASQHELALGQLAYAHIDRPVAGEARAEAQARHIAPMARDGAAEDRDDAEALPLGEGDGEAALGDAIDGNIERLAQAVEPGIGEAGDDHGARLIA